jgi:hypothetical protein
MRTMQLESAGGSEQIESRQPERSRPYGSVGTEIGYKLASASRQSRGSEVEGECQLRPSHFALGRYGQAASMGCWSFLHGRRFFWDRILGAFYLAMFLMPAADVPKTADALGRRSSTN